MNFEKNKDINIYFFNKGLKLAKAKELPIFLVDAHKKKRDEANFEVFSFK